MFTVPDTSHAQIPVPLRAVDYMNQWNGSVQVMWQVDHIKHHNGQVMFAFTKIGHYPVANPEQIYFMVSPNLLTESDPDKVTWTMWPEGERGVEAVGGTTSDASGISEEPHILPLLATAEEQYHVVFRTSQGYLGASHSQPGAPEKPWAASTYARYLPVDTSDDWVERTHPNASFLKHPRGPTAPKRAVQSMVEEGADAEGGVEARARVGGGVPPPLLMTFYNNNGLGAFATHEEQSDRNCMWLAAGWELNGTLRWSQPELVLYDRRRDHGHGCVYPPACARTCARTTHAPHARATRTRHTD